MFYDILERINAFLGYKNKKFKKLEKVTFLQLFFLGNIGEENVFYDILEQKTAFVGNKNKKFKKVEQLTFLQRG